MSFKRVIYTSAIDALNALFRSLTAYEQKYQMPSDEFYADNKSEHSEFFERFKKGEIGGIRRILWAI